MRARRVGVAVLLTLAANLVGLFLLVRVHHRDATALARPLVEARAVSMRVATPEPPPVEPEPLPVPRTLTRPSRSLLPVPDLPSAIRAPRLDRPDLDLALTLAPSVSPTPTDRDLVNRLLVLDVVDEPPRVTRRVLPEYPARAELMGVTDGRVLIEIVVSAEGRVEDVEVIESSPEGFFESVTVDAVRQWIFTPAIFQGRAVPVRARTEVTFRLEEW